MTRVDLRAETGAWDRLPASAGDGRWPWTALRGLPLAAAVLACVGCATSSVVRSDDPYLTAEAHEREAASEAAHARTAVEAGAPLGDVQVRARAASRHLEAAKSLREAEAAACAEGLLARAEAKSFPASVHRVEVIRVRVGTAPPAPMKVTPRDEVVGVRMTVHSDLTAVGLAALLNCRVARARARGDDGTDPVTVHGATFEVRSAKDGDLAVDVRVPSEASVEEVLRRAHLAAER